MENLILQWNNMNILKMIKKIFESENYCLYYTLTAIQNSKEEKNYDCQKGLLLQSLKNAGIEWGNLDITVKIGGQKLKLKLVF